MKKIVILIIVIVFSNLVFSVKMTEEQYLNGRGAVIFACENPECITCSKGVDAESEDFLPVQKVEHNSISYVGTNKKKVCVCHNFFDNILGSSGIKIYK